MLKGTDGDDDNYLEENNFRSAHRERPHKSSRSAEVVIVWQTADTFFIVHFALYCRLSIPFSYMVHIALYCRLPIPFSPTPCW